MISNFHSLALKGSQTSWKFQVSGGVSPEESERIPTPLQPLGFVDEPWDLMCRVKAVAVLTPLGFGSKTTIIDGLAAGCHVLVHPKLARRLPQETAEHCLPVDPSASPEAIADLLTQTALPPIEHSINEQLRNASIQALRTALSKCAAN